ncbi:MAG: 4-alpha-glucanotransferase [Bacteroidaceae bacterium]|nr:4-alpha-glucanotransferase [Bacteroidaceae bacterium]
MNIGFQLHYRTVWGESVSAALTWATKTGKETSMDIPLSTVDGEVWRGEATVPASAVEACYQYRIVQNGETVRQEWRTLPRQLSLPKGKNRVQTLDRWRDQPADTYRYTSAYTEAFVRHEHTEWPTTESEKAFVLRVFAPEVPQGQTLALLGSLPVLGEWEAGREVRLTCVDPNEWAVSLDLEKLDGTFEYKFLTIDTSTGKQCVWEMHDNRRMNRPNAERRMAVVYEDEPVRLPFAPWRGAGCVVPVFSLRSEKSFGVGDFGDLSRMVDWVSMTGQHVLQILPINDTMMTGKWTDSYPYNSISIYALHPIYADLSALPPLADAAQRTAYKAAQKKLNALSKVDYEQVMDTKRHYLRRLFHQEWKTVKASKAYKTFYAENEEWLIPYAAFCYLRDLYGTPDFHQWKTLSKYDAKKVKELTLKGTESADEIDLNCYIQFVLDEQLSRVRTHAREKGIVLKGDIPIGISPTSVEAWTEPHYFNLNGQAGAPPDFFSTNGQNWGFPTYNWDAMLADGCKWWRRRFEKMATHFDAYRIDHVLGFFRIWEIPKDSVHGLLGQFSPALPMSIDEIEHFGLPWRGDTYTKPYITDRIIYRLFGDDTAEVRRLYLEPQQNGRYSLKPEYDTQRKVQAAFANKGDERSLKIRDGLYTLISNVLFVHDRKNPELYHPRIDAHRDFLFEDLGDWEKNAFNRIHEHFFYHRHNQFWYEESMKKLPTLVGATRMLVCAEDLGMIPECVGWVMKQLQILTLEIQTMPKASWQTFANLWENPYVSVATISTHDMATMRGWWDEQREAAQQYFNQMLYHEGAAPHPMPGWVAEEIVSRHLECPSMLCLLSLQDWLSIDEAVRYPDPEAERINVPANPRHYWQWRMHVSIEQLMANTALNEKIRGLIKSYGR